MHTPVISQPVLGGMYDAPAPDAPRPHKRQRATARAVYHRQRAIDEEKQANGKGETRKAQVLRLLARFWNVHQYSPTALELLEWARLQGEKLFDVNSIRPKLFYLEKDGLVEVRAKRKCTVSKLTVQTWAVREIGSQEAR